MSSGSKKSAPKLRFKPERKGFPIEYNRFLRQCHNEDEALERADEFWRSLSPDEKKRRDDRARERYNATHPPKPKPVETAKQKAE